MLYVDIPTPADINGLYSHRGDVCVSIYLPTTPVTHQAQADRITLKNLAKAARQQLATAGADNAQIAGISEQFDDLIDDDEFWRFQARSLAIFATPKKMRTFRVPNALETIVQVSNRFHIKPLLRSISFPNTCFVLALAQKSVRVIEVSSDLPVERISVEALPEDAGRAVQGAGEIGYWPSGRIHGAEGQKVLLRQFARRVDKALRAVIAGSDVPLVLAAAEPLASIYRSVNSYSQLAEATIAGSPEGMTDAELGERARAVLDGIYRSQVEAWRDLFAERESEGRATTDIAQAARAAATGAVECVLIDIDAVIPGDIDDRGGIVFAKEGPATYDLVNEIAGRVIVSGGQVIGVRKADLPRDAALAALLRYPV